MTAFLAIGGSLAVAALAAVALLLSYRKDHNRWTGGALIAIYLAFMWFS